MRLILPQKWCTGKYSAQNTTYRFINQKRINVCNKYNEKTKTNTETEKDLDIYNSHIQEKKNDRIAKEHEKQLAKSNNPFMLQHSI